MVKRRQWSINGWVNTRYWQRLHWNIKAFQNHIAITFFDLEKKKKKRVAKPVLFTHHVSIQFYQMTISQCSSFQSYQRILKFLCLIFIFEIIIVFNQRINLTGFFDSSHRCLPKTHNLFSSSITHSILEQQLIDRYRWFVSLCNFQCNLTFVTSFLLWNFMYFYAMITIATKWNAKL